MIVSWRRPQISELQPLKSRMHSWRRSKSSSSGNPATREELLDAMLRYFLSVGVDEDDIGGLSLDKMPNPSLFRFGLAEDGPVPVYTSKSKYAALILDLGNLSRGRKHTAPSAYSDLNDYDSYGGSRGTLITSIAQSKSHLFMLCEASEISKGELDFLYSRRWQTIQNKSGGHPHWKQDKSRGFRFQSEAFSSLAGSTLVGVAHSHLPLTYMIVEISWGDCACWKSRESGRALTASASACSTLKTRLLQRRLH
eukprot:s5091_g4.t1